MPFAEWMSENNQWKSEMKRDLNNSLLDETQEGGCDHYDKESRKGGVRMPPDQTGRKRHYPPDTAPPIRAGRLLQSWLV